MREEHWQGARRRVELQLGKSKKKNNYGRLLSSRPAELPLLAELASRRACFTAVKSPCPFRLEISVHHFLAAAQRLVSQRHPTVSQYQILCWGIFAFYGLLEQLKSSPELKTIWIQRGEKTQAKFQLHFILYLQAKCSEEIEDVRKAHLTIDSGSLWGISGAL